MQRAAGSANLRMTLDFGMKLSLLGWRSAEKQWPIPGKTQRSCPPLDFHAFFAYF